MYPERKRNRQNVISEEKYEREIAEITKQLNNDTGLTALMSQIHKITGKQRPDIFYALSSIVVSYKFLSKPQYESNVTVGDTVKALKRLHGHLSKSLYIVTNELSQSVEGGLSSRFPDDLASLIMSNKLSINRLPPHQHTSHFASLLSALTEASDSYLAYQKELMADLGMGRSSAQSDSKMDGFIWNMIRFFIEYFPETKIGSSKTNSFSLLCHYIAEEYLQYNKELTRHLNSNLKLFNNH